MRSYGSSRKFLHKTRTISVASGKSNKRPRKSRSGRGGSGHLKTSGKSLKRLRKSRSSRGGSGPLQEFFDSYPPFVYDSSSSASSEFYRLCDYFNWNSYSPNRQDAHEAFKDALVKQFNVNFGTNANDLTAWQGLCASLGVDPIPDELAACRRIVEDTHVNLVDLTDSFTSGKSVTIFESEVALSEYTKAHGRFFPRENAHAGNLLKHLLRHIFNPSGNRGGQRRF